MTRNRVTTRGLATCGGTLLLFAASAVVPLPAQGGDLHAPSLAYGSGIVRTPVALVAARSGELRLFTSGTSPGQAGAGWNLDGAVETHWLGRMTVGMAVHSNSPEWGLFGSVLLMEEQRNGVRPAVAVGFRNLGPYRHMDRLQASYPGVGAAPSSPLPHAEGFRTSPTLFAVATRSLTIGPLLATANVGAGNGLFADDGGLGAEYSRRGTLARGLFLGARLIVWSTGALDLSVAAENDGFDWNAGVAGSWRGLTAGIYGTELEEGSGNRGSGAAGRFYNYRKLHVAVGYRTNVHDVLGGSEMRRTLTALERERESLRSEISRREERIRGMEDQLHALQAGELGEVRRRREQLESRIREERDAIRRAEERLRDLESERTPRSGESRPNR